MIVLGIDCGLTGAVAAISSDRSYAGVFDLPVIASGKSAKVQTHIDAAGLAETIKQARIAAGSVDVWMAAVERVAAMPGQGVSSVFSLGDSFGAIRATLAVKHIACEFVTPNAWKRYYGLDGDKERARAKAIELFPGLATSLSRKKDHNRAEAILVADWLLRKLS